MMRQTLLAIAITLPSSGCQLFQPGPSLPASAQPVVAKPILPKDLPIPAGFTCAKRGNFTNHTNYEASRLVLSRPNARLDLNPVVRYLEKELPRFGWDIDFIAGQSVRRIIAHRAGETCEIVLSRKALHNRLYMVIERSRDVDRSS